MTQSSIPLARLTVAHRSDVRQGRAAPTAPGVENRGKAKEWIRRPGGVHFHTSPWWDGDERMSGVRVSGTTGDWCPVGKRRAGDRKEQQERQQQVVVKVEGVGGWGGGNELMRQCNRRGEGGSKVS